MKNALSTLAFVAAVLLGSAALADGFGNGTVNEIVVYANGSALINLVGAYTNIPACNTMVSAGYKRFNLDITTAPGRTVYATLLTAMHAKTGVFLGGAGECRDGAEVLRNAFTWPSP